MEMSPVAEVLNCNIKPWVRMNFSTFLDFKAGGMGPLRVTPFNLKVHGVAQTIAAILK